MIELDCVSLFGRSVGSEKLKYVLILGYIANIDHIFARCWLYFLHPARNKFYFDLDNIVYIYVLKVIAPYRSRHLRGEWSEKILSNCLAFIMVSYQQTQPPRCMECYEGLYDGTMIKTKQQSLILAINIFYR
jgi:hypothetical protein